ncbi:polysaccharide deacetylase 2 family uncharacterized protein YibQ [Roseovarius sp. MBR-78]|uniref:divergent polysaccharide deacteylase family protein n=1 Tax=Roseovarius sp. MBR-78 TaxID=3156460 RepID=UPI003397A4C0
MRGVLAGMITGFAVSGLVLGAVSVGLDLAGGAALRERAPEADAVKVPPGSGFDAVREDRAAALPAPGDSPEAGTGAVPRVPAPAPDDTLGLSGADTAPPPATGTATTLGTPPVEASDTGSVAVQGDSPVLPSPQALAPTRPESEARLPISTEPAQPPQPDPGESAVGLAPGAGQRVGAAPDETGTETSPGESMAAPAPDEGAPETAPETAPAPRRLQPEGGGALVQDRAEGVTTDRLPRIGEAPEEGAVAPQDEAAPAPAPPEPALARNAVAAEVPPGKPLMAIVLIDDGSGALGREALGAFPYPLSIAIPATHPDAGAAAARYREAGFEVLLDVDLPEGASAADVEVAMAAWLDRVPQAVAVIEGDGTGLQSSREASAQLAPILLETGHGLVMRPNGLDTAQKLIAREGVPSATLFRDFDAQGQNAAAVRRFLDQAAVRAGQRQTGVIMLGRLRADTISALLIWGLQDRAASVALVPVSAVLRRGAAQ